MLHKETLRVIDDAMLEYKAFLMRKTGTVWRIRNLSRIEIFTLRGAHKQDYIKVKDSLLDLLKRQLITHLESIEIRMSYNLLLQPLARS